MPVRKTPPHHLVPALALALLAPLLGGCVDTAVDAAAVRPAPQKAVARPGVSPHGASVALTSLEGAPDTLAERFRQALSGAAERNDVAFAAPEAAQYRIRGYLTATPAPEGTRYSCVFDVFDRHGRRAQRLTDEAIAKSGAAGWEGLDEKALGEVARRGADDLAAFLTNTPEAIAASEGGESGVSVVSVQRPGEPAPGRRPLGYAEAR